MKFLTFSNFTLLVYLLVLSCFGSSGQKSGGELRGFYSCDYDLSFVSYGFLNDTIEVGEIEIGRLKVLFESSDWNGAYLVFDTHGEIISSVPFIESDSTFVSGGWVEDVDTGDRYYKENTIIVIGNCK
jgi:hypothetical protein